MNRLTRSPRHTSTQEHTSDMVCLAKGEIATVEACACGAIHLHLGAMTIRLTREALRSLLGTLEDAVLADTLRNAPRPAVDTSCVN